MKLIHLIICMGLICQPLMLCAEVIAKYTFDKRVPKGQERCRLHSATYPYHGKDYNPNPNAGELGPPLQNYGGGGENWNYYRSYFTWDATEASKGRQALELKQNHVFSLDAYRTKTGANCLPESGSFTWEAVVRIGAFDGANHCGLLLDNTKGEGRLPNYPGKATVCRLWMGPAKEGKFSLNFTIPTDKNNHGVTLSAPIKLDTWHHLAAVYDDKTQEAFLYINEKLKAKRKVTSSKNRATGFGIGMFSSEVIRTVHGLYLQKALIDALAFTNDVRAPGTFVLRSASSTP